MHRPCCLCWSIGADKNGKMLGALELLRSEAGFIVGCWAAHDRTTGRGSSDQVNSMRDRTEIWMYAARVESFRCRDQPRKV